MKRFAVACAENGRKNRLCPPWGPQKILLPHPCHWVGGFFEAVRRFWNLGFYTFCQEYGTENVPMHELRDFYGHSFRGSCAKWARMWRLWQRFAFVRLRLRSFRHLTIYFCDFFDEALLSSLFAPV